MLEKCVALTQGKDAEASLQQPVTNYLLSVVAVCKRLYMLINKILSFVSLIGGLIILLIGITLQLCNFYDHSYIFTKNGGAGTGTINGPGAILLGISALCLSANSYYNYTKMKKLHTHQKAQEDAEAMYGQKKARKNLERLRNIKSKT